jgi:hypothetical protein
MIKIAFPYIEISRVVAASSNRAWGLLTDTCTWKEWGPSLLDVRSSDRYIKKGSHGRVKTALHFFGINATGHRVEPLDESSCRLVFQVPLWAAPYLVVCKIALDRIVELLNR